MTREELVDLIRGQTWCYCWQANGEAHIRNREHGDCPIVAAYRACYGQYADWDDAAVALGLDPCVAVALVKEADFPQQYPGLGPALGLPPHPHQDA